MNHNHYMIDRIVYRNFVNETMSSRPNLDCCLNTSATPKLMHLFSYLYFLISLYLHFSKSYHIQNKFIIISLYFLEYRNDADDILPYHKAVFIKTF